MSVDKVFGWLEAVEDGSIEHDPESLSRITIIQKAVDALKVGLITDTDESSLELTFHQESQIADNHAQEIVKTSEAERHAVFDQHQNAQNTVTAVTNQNVPDINKQRESLEIIYRDPKTKEYIQNGLKELEMLANSGNSHQDFQYEDQTP